MDTFASLQQQLADADSLFLDLGDFRIHYKRVGRGPVLILLLHGSFLSLRSWRHVMQPLSAGATVVACDRPVCGLTSRPLPRGKDASLYTPEAQSDLVADLIQALGFERAVLVGHSTGGTVAVLTALRHPGRVSALVLVGAMIYSGYATSQVPAPVLALMKRFKPAFTRLMRLMIDRLYAPAMRKFWYRQERFTDATLATYKSDFMLGPWDKAFIELFLATRHLGLDRLVPELRLPTLVVTGEHDRAVKPDESRRLAQEIPGAELQVVPDCGHLPHEETPEVFIEAVQGFLRRSRLID